MELIKEIAEYDVDGIELDFLRHPVFFNQSNTTLQRRKDVVNAFVAAVKSIIDSRTQADREPRLLGLRVPWKVEAQERLGIDLVELENLGVDYFIFGSFLYSEQPHMHEKSLAFRDPSLPQQPDSRMMSDALENSKVYWELFPDLQVEAPNPGDDKITRRMSRFNFYAASYLAYIRGLDGVSLFNFQYFREYGNNTVERGPWLLDPPFGLVPCLRDRACIDHQRHNYFLAGHFEPAFDAPHIGANLLPYQFDAENNTKQFALSMAPRDGGWLTSAVVRVRLREPVGDESLFTIKFNGIALAKTAQNPSLFKAEYTDEEGTKSLNNKVILESPENFLYWKIPPENLVNGVARLELHYSGSDSVTAELIEISAY